jgi:hypothetical protein
VWTFRGKHFGRFHDEEVYGRDGKYLGEINSSRLITNKAKASRRKTSFGPYASRAGTVAHTAYVGYAMYSGYEDFPVLINSKSTGRWASRPSSLVVALPQLRKPAPRRGALEAPIAQPDVFDDRCRDHVAFGVGHGLLFPAELEAVRKAHVVAQFVSDVRCPWAGGIRERSGNRSQSDRKGSLVGNRTDR